MMIEAPSLQQISGTRHGFFTRQGGVSSGIYASLNTGFGSDDDGRAVQQNRDRIADSLGVERRHLLSVWQHHSADALVAEAAWDVRKPPKADAMVTAVPGLALGVLTADCTPVLFSNADGTVVGAAHAGWKGALGGILKSTVRAMRELGATDIHTAIGPTISRSTYEVGPEFPGRFIEQDASNRRFFTPSRKAGHHMFDLPWFVRCELEKLDLAGIEDMALCTYSDEDRFFSYRRTTHRQEADYGRQISVIVIK